MLKQHTDTLYDRIKASIKALHAELPVREHNYAWQDNGSNVLAVAHCDFVGVDGLSRKVGGYVKDGSIVLSPRLDDRLGVWLILDVLPKYANFDILLTTDEEIGRSTAQFFDKKEYNWVFSFDRRGTDAVTYDYRCMDAAVKKHFQYGQGSFSDICFLDQPGVNVGTGYYDEHTTTCYADLRHTQKQVKRFLKFYDEFADTKFVHVPEFKPVKKTLTYREREARWDEWEAERRKEWEREEQWELEIARQRWGLDDEDYRYY